MQLRQLSQPLTRTRPASRHCAAGPATEKSARSSPTTLSLDRTRPARTAPHTKRHRGRQVAISRRPRDWSGFAWSPAKVTFSLHTRGWPVPIRLPRALAQPFPRTRGDVTPPHRGPRLPPPGRPIIRKGGAVGASRGGTLQRYRRPGLHSLNCVQELCPSDGLD